MIDLHFSPTPNAQKVSIALEYYEKGGGAVIELQWLVPNTSTYVTVPASRLNAQ